MQRACTLPWHAQPSIETVTLSHARISSSSDDNLPRTNASASLPSKR